MKPRTYHIAQLMTKYFRESLTEEEKNDLQHWIEEDPENNQLLESFRKTEDVQQEINFIGTLDIDGAWKRLQEERKQKKLKRVIRYIGYAAAVILLVLPGLWLMLPTKQLNPEGILQSNHFKRDILPGGKKAMLILSDGQTIGLGKLNNLSEKNGAHIIDAEGEIKYGQSPLKTKELIYNTLVVPKAGTYHLTLADGTKVWLNALSKIRFPVQFDRHNRKVYLEGEAYFEVAKDSNRPFSVEVNGSTIEVLGTSFNINSYKPTSTTTLVEGSVRVSNGTTQQLLKPGQQAHVGDDIRVEQADILKVTAWKSGDFYFKSDHIDEIMEQLSRWYDVDVQFAGEVPKSKGYNGSIRRDVNLSEVLQMLNYVSGARFELEGRTVYVQF